jgi:hypothetical protein
MTEAAKMVLGDGLSGIYARKACCLSSAIYGRKRSKTTMWSDVLLNVSSIIEYAPIGKLSTLKQVARFGFYIVEALTASSLNGKAPT